MAGLGIARSFQIMNLFDDFTALENVLMALPRCAPGLALDPAAARRQRLPAIGRPAVLASVGLRRQDAGRRDSSPMASGVPSRSAWRWRPSRASSSSTSRPPGSAPTGTARLAELSCASSRSATRIVMIEHDMRFLFSLADRISVIHWGQVIAEGTPEELRADPWVRASDLARAA